MRGMVHTGAEPGTPFAVLLSSGPSPGRRGRARYVAAAVAIHAALLAMLVWWTTRPRPVTPIERGSFLLIRLPDEPPAPQRELVAPGTGGADVAATTAPAEAWHPAPRPARKAAPPPHALVVEDIAEAPTFTPFTVAPTLANRSVIIQELRQQYTPAVQRDAAAARVLLWLLLDEHGDVRKVLLKETSGNVQLDQAAFTVARDMRFTPALNHGDAVPVWVAIPVEFRVDQPQPPSVAPAATPGVAATRGVS